MRVLLMLIWIMAMMIIMQRKSISRFDGTQHFKKNTDDDDYDDGLRRWRWWVEKPFQSFDGTQHCIASAITFHALGVTDSLQSRKYPAVYKWRADVMLILVLMIVLVITMMIPTTMLIFMDTLNCTVSEEDIILFYFLHFCIHFLNTNILKEPLFRHLTEDGFEKSWHSLAFLVRQFHYVYTGSLVRKEWPTKPLRLFALKVIRTAEFFFFSLFPCFKHRCMLMMNKMTNMNEKEEKVVKPACLSNTFGEFL